MANRLPNFLYIGPDKAGSSWLHEVLGHHPNIYLSEAKDLYFFDRYYERGLPWYAHQFRGATEEHDIVGEVCPDYLASPDAAQRISACLPDARLMVTLRDPLTRAFSSYLYMRKHGEGPPTFRQALDSFPDLIEHGSYGSQLRRFASWHQRGLLHISVFDDLQRDPQGFFDGVVSFLGLPSMELDDTARAAKLPASKARIVPVAWLARRAADVVRRHDGAALVGRIKRSTVTQRLLYIPLAREEIPTIEPADQDYVQSRLSGEVARVEDDFGISLRARWGW